MKTTQIAELLANIRKSFVSFFSILMFVALGVGIFLGISWAGPALQGAADAMFDEGRFHNFQIQVPYGLTDDDLEKLSATEGVTQIEAGRQSFQTVRSGDSKYTVKVQSIGQEIDVPIVVKGRLPEKHDEMAFHAESAKALGLGVGDSVTFEHDAGQGFALSSGAASGNASSEDADHTGDMKYLTSDTFTVTAIVESADYIANSAETYGFSNAPSGTVEALAWVPGKAFDASAFQMGYPVVNVRCDGLGGLGTFGDEYAQKSNGIAADIKALGQELAFARYDKLHGDAQAKVDDAEKQLNDVKTQVADGEKQIAEGEAQLSQARAELDAAVAQGEAELASGYEELMAGEAAKAEGEAKLAAASAKLNDGRAKLAEVDELKAEGESTANEMSSYKAEQDKALKSGKITQKEHDANLDEHGAQMRKRANPLAKRAGVTLPKIDHTNYGEAIVAIRTAVDNVEDMDVEVEGETMTVAQARKKLAQYEREYAAAQAEYNAKTAELSAGWERYHAGQAELESRKAQGEQEISDGEAKLESARQQVAEGKAKIAENEPQLAKAKKEVADMKEYGWSVTPRAYNAGVVQVVTFSNVTNRLSISMAALFIIVGLLVSYFAVSRIVHEQVTQIGTKKALGFRKGEITRSFLLYSGIAVAAGAIIGALIAFFLVEGIIGGVLADMFSFGTYPAFFGWPLFIAIAVLELALVLGATYLACRSILKEHAVVLLRGDKPPTGKTRFYEKWGIWEKLPLFVQTIVNNCVNDRRRVLSTIVGVAGSTALIVTAITLNNDVMKSYDRQYEDVYGFNAIAYVNGTSENAADNVDAALQSEGASTARVFMKRYLMEQPDGGSDAMRIVVPFDEDAFARVYHVKPTTGGSFDLSGEGAWVSQAYAEHMGAKVGDAITIDGGDGTKHEVPILGFCDFWLTYYEMVMSTAYYEKEFGDVSANAMLVQTNGTPVDDVRQAIANSEGFDSIVDDATYQHHNFETFSSVSGAVVAIYLALAALMAIVVLLNLNVMFIDEKKRELIVLMINGFSQKDAKHYISYDSIVLTAIGVLVGIVLGCIMGSVTVAAIEPSTGVFVKSVDLWAVVIGIVGSLILAYIMSAIALRRIPKFKLIDINRF